MITVDDLDGMYRTRDLKTEFISLQKCFVGKPLTRDNMENLIDKFERLFEEFGLSDLKWKLSTDITTGTITFVPIREIDKYAIKGILAFSIV